MGAEPVSLPLACSVRACGERLVRGARAFACARGHAFDLAKSGYLNLLQPQDRRSLAAGDARAEIEARARLLAAGVGAELGLELARRGRALGLPGGALALELGSGSGERLAALVAELGLVGIGLDLSSAAAEHAARRFPALTWVVANADRRLPLLDASVALVLTIHGRRNPAECARVLAPGAHLVAALPAPDDLLELRARVQGQGLERERVGAFLAEHAQHFELRAQTVARERRRLERAQLLDLLAGTYRGARRSSAAAVKGLEALGELEVTLASDVLVLVRR